MALDTAFPTPLAGGGLPSWAITIVVSAAIVTIFWFTALVILVVFEVRRRRSSYRWVPSRPRSPDTPPKKAPPPSLASPRSPQRLSGDPPPRIPLPSLHHSSSSSSSSPPTPSEQFPPLFSDTTSYPVEVPNLDPFEEPEKEFHLHLIRSTSATSSMASSMASSGGGGGGGACVIPHLEATKVVVNVEKVPVVSFSKPQAGATPTSPTPFTDLSEPHNKNGGGGGLAGMILSRPVTLKQLGATIREPGYLEGEFRKLPNPMVAMEDIPKGTERMNRYSNVLPTPRTRVVLPLMPGCPNSDYINANHIRGYQGQSRQYIATQGPMDSTVEPFWRMVWENGTDIIVMATNFQERGIDKCTRYWPAQGTGSYGSLEVSVVHQTVQDTYRQATLSLRNLETGEVRSVRHYRLTCWPHQGVPKETRTITKLLREIKMADSAGPVVVHCSAGIGRTGVLIAIDIGLQAMLQGQAKVDVLRIISTLRQDRLGSVQTREQYLFIHQALYEVGRELGPQRGAWQS